jgi:hypothetical protein
MRQPITKLEKNTKRLRGVGNSSGDGAARRSMSDIDEIVAFCWNAVLKALAQHIRERLNVTKSCTVFEAELERVWPRKRYAASLREKRILSFAKSHGFETIIWDPGIRITFRKARKS